MTDIVDLTDQPDQPDHLDLDEAAALMGITPAAVITLVDNRTFPVPVITLAEETLVPRARLVRWIEGGPESDGGPE